MKRVRVLAVLMAGVVMGVVSGMGQSVSADSTAVFSVPTLIRLVLNVTTIDFGTLTEADYDRGYKEAPGAQIVSVWSNRRWILSVAAKEEQWTGQWAKPASDLRLRVASVNRPDRITDYLRDLTGLTRGGFTIAEGLPGGNLQHTMDFRVLVSWENDVPGAYSLGFTYTLTAP